MTTFNHKQIVKLIAKADARPADPSAFSRWIRAENHLDILEFDLDKDEIIIYGSGPYTFIHSLVVSNNVLNPPDWIDLLSWSCNPFSSAAGYVCSGEPPEISVERASYGSGSRTLINAKNLIFGRTFEGWSGPSRTYIEILQEYAHLSDIHWRPEHHSYCRFDHNGDLHKAVSITKRGDDDSEISLVSFTWNELEAYLTTNNCCLIRMFDFTLLDHSNFSAWSDKPENIIKYSNDIVFRQKIESNCAYTRGVQILGPRNRRDRVFGALLASWGIAKSKEHATFTAQDWRNGKITKISTDPNDTTNYFEADSNELPFELSPAFFRPEVLSKYKTDRDKYTIEERSITCRTAWHLRGFDVNEAGQIHAYICDLRALPYSEQLHWLSYNEEPKASISRRALINDFEGQFVTFQNPLRELLGILQSWQERKVAWWTLRDTQLPKRVSLPLTTSVDEWSEAFMDLSKLIVEGLELKNIRTKLKQHSMPFNEKEQSLLLLEKLIGEQPLSGLRTIQLVRSKIRGHAGSSEAETIKSSAIIEYGSFSDHFTAICKISIGDLERIERAMSK